MANAFWTASIPDTTLRWWAMPAALLLEKQTLTGVRFHLCQRAGQGQRNLRGLACLHHAEAERRQLSVHVTWSGQDHEQLLQIDLRTDPAAMNLIKNYDGTGISGQAHFLNIGTQTRYRVRREAAFFVAYALCGNQISE